MINIKHLNLIRSNRFLLKDISLEINKGIHTVVGPNGAGKTTLLRSISGVFSDYQDQFNISEKRSMIILDQNWQKIVLLHHNFLMLLFLYSKRDN